jgi:subtilisin family serine protease
MFMNRRFVKTLSLTIVSLLVIPFMMGIGPDKQRKIVVFNEGVSEEQRTKIIMNHGGEKVHELGIINGQSIMLPARKADVLAAQPEVLRVEDDALVTTLAKPGTSTPPPAQTEPWGIDKINAEECWAANNTGDNVKVAVVDTGIAIGHPDLGDNLRGGVSFVSYTKSYNDDNGHGSHVAGIIGALNNTIGVVGVGPQVDLYAVKVLDRKGSGYISDIIKGLEWCAANQMNVVNMSLGSSVYSPSLYEAVKKVYAAGIIQVAAAGNSGKDVIYPAAHDEVIAVGATDSSDILAYFSSRGPQVDLVAPGVSIYSTYKGTGYTTMSGTSMASPHVAGAAALVIQSGKASTPAAVQAQLERTAIDLGVTGRDELYGSGLVNAYNAISK